MKFAISVDLVRKAYRRSWRESAKEALKGISLSIGEGETFGFVGPNGAGKSTLIKILVGTLRPDSGSAAIFDRPVSDPASRLGLGFVPENPSLSDCLTPFETLRMSLALHRVDVPDAKVHCMTWLDRLELASVAHKPLRGFSKGMLQRTALANAMAIKPRLLILDEPLSGLDPVGRKDVVDMLDEYRRGGGTLFFSSHVLYDVERIADRFGLIHKGELIAMRSPQEIVADQADSYALSYRGERPVASAHEIRPGLFRVDVRAAELADLIARIQAVSGIIQEVRPTASLEAVFFKTIAEREDKY